MTKVVFPCDRETWGEVKAQLAELKEISLQDECDLQLLSVIHQKVYCISHGLGGEIEFEFRDRVFCGLVKFLRKHASPEEKSHFLQDTLPRIIELSVLIETLVPEDGVTISFQREASTTELGRQLVTSILACAFLCLFPNEHRGAGSLLNVINFEKFFGNLPMFSQNAKLRCILNFFDRVGKEWDSLTGSILYTRQVIKRDELPTLDTWLNCEMALCPVTVYQDGVIEDAGCEALEVDFANRFIGGGVLGRGRVQEEIRFCVCPELIASMLFMEVMEENEAIVIQGYEQFSETKGYAAQLQYAGNHRDTATVDSSGNLKNMLCAIDAISYRQGDSSKQYSDVCVLRDLNKAFAGFGTRFLIPLGVGIQRECSSEEDYFTADENGSQEDDSQYMMVGKFVDNLMARAVTLALPEAVRQQTDGESGVASMVRWQKSGDHEGSGSNVSHSSESVSGDEVSMDHLEVNFRDWLAHYRRRSSNLSDLSSRRSSYDLASRRSSCSTRYSSEYSTEFEELYDSFQQHEHTKYKYHTIKEEVGTPACNSVINDFATNLASSLVNEGTRIAVLAESGVRRFHSWQPTDVANKPQPVKITSDPTAGSLTEACIRTFVNNLFKDVWPFPARDSAASDSMEPSPTGVHRTICSCCQASGPSEKATSLNDDRNGGDDDDDETDYDAAERDRKDVEKHLGINIEAEPSTVSAREERLELEVANRLVSKAMCEALREYRASLQRDREEREAVSQSNHSMVTEDQSNETSVLVRTDKNRPAETVADQVMKEIFQFLPKKSELCHASDKSRSDSIHVQNAADCDKCSDEDYSSQFNPVIHISLAPVTNETSSYGCDDSSDNLVNMTEPNMEMYQRIAEKLLQGGLTSALSDVQQPDEKSRSAADGHSHDSGIPSCDQMQIYEDSCDYVLAGCASEDEGNNQSLSSHILSIQCEDPSIDGPVSHSNQSHFPVVQMNQPCVSQPESSSDQKNENGGNVNFVQTQMEVSDSSSTDQSSTDTSAPKSKPFVQSHSLTVTYPKRPRDVSSRNLRRRFSGNGDLDNFDQFANSLSRHVLTNAFLEVQNRDDPINFPRRSSEPMQISNGAALQRLEHTAQLRNGKTAQKSKTDEDIGQFIEEMSRHGVSCDVGWKRRSSSGFRDPVLSRFAEELTKANVAVPTFQWFDSGNLSTTGSSRSVCSTVSSFRDPVLASFEEELLSCSIGKSSTKSSWSKIKSTGRPPRQRSHTNESEMTNNFSRPHNSLSFDSEMSALSWRSIKSSSLQQNGEDMYDFAEELSRRILHDSVSFVCRMGRSERRSLQRLSHSPHLTFQDYCALMARDILRTALSEVESRKVCSDWLEQNKMVTWNDDTERLEYSDETEVSCSGSEEDDEIRMELDVDPSHVVEFEDALDIPYQKLEEFAEVLAGKVLVNSVSIWKRDQECLLRRQYGRPISTGNWGCGAFGGDPHLKSLIQWMAASYAGTPHMLFYSFHHHKMTRFQEVVDVVKDRGWNVACLMQAVRRYCIMAEEQIQQHGVVSHDLFDVILNGEVFPGIS